MNTPQTYLVDYARKLTDRYSTNDIATINNMLSFFNYCFVEQNNFEIDNFQKSSLKMIYLGYYKIKSNILDSSVNNIFDSLTLQQLKTIRFVFINASKNNKSINNVWDNGNSGKQLVTDIINLVSEQLKTTK